MEQDAASGKELIQQLVELREELRVALAQVRTTEAALDEMIAQGYDTGYDCGWVGGILAAADYLEEKGFLKNAKDVRSLTDGNLLALPYAGEA